ncbi:MAG: RNA polymerase sigma factor [Planctomycetota bacterium]|jgi:RNA polymerase sigma-70 factor (ECF subfamily)
MAPDTHKDPSDAELVRRCRRGAVDAFDALVRRHQEKIYNAVLRFCGNREDAADITQRAFLNAYRKIGDFKGDAAFTTWMYRIAFNQSISFRREQGRRRTVSLTSGSGGEEKTIDPAVRTNPTEGLEQDDERRIVRQALDRLEEGDRKIIVLKDLEECSYDQIASVLGVPKGTVRSRLHRARLAFREKVKGLMGTRPGEKASK